MIVKTKRQTVIEIMADICFVLYLFTELAFRHTFIGRIGLILFVVSIGLLCATKTTIKSSFYFIFSALFIIYNLVNIIEGVSVNSESSLRMIRTLCLNFIVMFFLYNYVLLRNDMEIIIKYYVYVNLFFTVCIVLLSVPTLFNERLGTSVGINANVIAINSAISYLMGFYFLLKNKKKYNIIILSWFLLVVILTASRKGLLIIVLGLALLLFLMFPKNRVKILVISILIIVCIYILLINIPILYELVGFRIKSLINYTRGLEIQDDSLRTRNTLINRGWNYFLSKPWRGYGLDGFKFLEGSYGMYSHNNFIEILVSGGVIAFAIYYTNYAIILIKAFLLGEQGHDIMKLMFTIAFTMLIMDYGAVTYFGRMYINIPILTVSFARLSEINTSHHKEKAKTIKISAIKKYINNPCRIFALPAARRAMSFIPDKVYLKILFYSLIGRKLNLENPKTFNEKLQWLKLYDRNPIYTKLVDKYEVRKFMASVIGEEYLIPLIGVWDKVEDIDFNILPNQFVLKCTHDSGGIIICTDKSKLNIANVKKKLRKCLNKNFYYYGREWPYKNIKPKIICEKYMTDESGTALKDYKLMCFNGKVKCVFVCSNRNSVEGLNIDIYDMNWDLMPVQRPDSPNSGVVTPKPKTFDMMVEFAQRLSKDIPFVRVDFYEINGQLYFGELTFYPASGFEKFEPESYDYLLGSWLQLPSINCK